MEIGIRELKRRLSEFIDRAAQGQVIRVTDRGKPKAMLGPLPGRVQLDRGVEEGWITRETAEPPVPVRRRARAKGTITEALLEDRGA